MCLCFLCVVRLGAGMRRPSWNKSQAIQQVIMLKTLLETTPDSDASARKRLCISRPNTTDSSSNVRLESVRDSSFCVYYCLIV